jgi:HSP90 family molecular chaperone
LCCTEKALYKTYVHLCLPLREFVLRSVPCCAGKTIVDAGKEASQDLSEEERQAKQAHNEESEAFRHWMKDALGDKITRVEASSRLVDSPATLVQSEYGVSPSMQKYLRAQVMGWHMLVSYV